MKFVKKTGISSLLIFGVVVSNLSAGVYVVPQEYDNLTKSVKSSAFGVINQATSNMSNNKYTIGGSSQNYRCLKVEKIKCVSTTPSISANISEASLKRPSSGELLSTYQLDLRVEDDATYWYLCGAGYGGQMWDDSTLTSKKVGSSTEITYTYNPNAKGEDYLYFTDVAIDSDSSFLSISYHQTCK